MRKVHLTPWWWAVAGGTALVLLAAVDALPPAGAAAGGGYLVVSTALLSRGLRRGPAARLGPANAVTATRSTLVGIATALVAASFSTAIPVPLLVATAVIALSLDALDGPVARRTGTATALGARFDMEVDAFLILVLAVYDARIVGWWVLGAGMLRYAFVAAAWLWPWMRRTLPARFWRKVAAAAAGIVLTVIAAGLLPPAAAMLLAAAALALLVESFGRDVLWLVRMNRTAAGLVSPPRALRRAGREESSQT